MKEPIPFTDGGFVRLFKVIVIDCGGINVLLGLIKLERFMTCCDELLVIKNVGIVFDIDVLALNVEGLTDKVVGRTISIIINPV